MSLDPLTIDGAVAVVTGGAGGIGKTPGELKKRATNDLSTQQRRVNMADDKNNSGPEEGVKGVVEDVKGKAKEAVGTVTGRNDMVDEGKAQQDKADAQRDAAKKEAEADAARSVTDHDQCGEREASATLDDLGHTVDVDDPGFPELGFLGGVC